jgi:hypothetical protein
MVFLCTRCILKKIMYKQYMSGSLFSFLLDGHKNGLTLSFDNKLVNLQKTFQDFLIGQIFVVHDVNGLEITDLCIILHK